LHRLLGSRKFLPSMIPRHSLTCTRLEIITPEVTPRQDQSGAGFHLIFKRENSIAMKNISKSVVLTTLLFAICSVAYGLENIGMPGHRVADTHRIEAGDCKAATSQIDLNINNVRARLMNGGDMWWDLISTA